MSMFKMPFREQNSNKGTFGKVLNFCGSDNYIGAAYLSTVSSLKVGAGLSALCSTNKVIKSVSSMLPEAVYFNFKDGFKKIDNFTVVLIGCGLGIGLNSVRYFKKVINILQGFETIPVVIDADGLNILAKNRLKLPQNTIITPHPMEAARLLDCSLEEVLNNLEKAAQNLSLRYECITVLKSHRTIVCDKDMNIYVNEFGNSALAKAGSGDVLAGVIAGLLAQKMSLFEAAKLGVYLHSRAGEFASEKLSEYSVLSSDLINYLPCVIKELVSQ